MKRKLSAWVLAFMAVNIACLAVAEDPYIESSGVGGIDTGYRIKPNSRIVVDFALTTIEQSKSARLFGADYNTSVLNIAFGFLVGSYDSNPCWVFGYGDPATGWHEGWVKDSSKNYLYIDTDRHVAEYDFPGGKYTYYTDGKAVAWQTDSPGNYAKEATSSVTLFSTRDNSGAERPSKARIYSVKIYEKIDGAYVLVRDFKPCKVDGIPGFTCTETGIVIGAGNPASFSAGGDGLIVRESSYVATPESNYDDATGQTKAYIDTHYFATDATRVELDYALRTAPLSGKASWLFCGYGSSIFGVCSKNGGFLMSNGNGWPSISSSAATEVGVRRTAILDNVSDHFYLVTAGVTNLTKSANASKGTYSQYPIKVGGYYNGSSEFCALKVYALRIYEAGVLVRDFRPCKSDGVVALKDLLTDSLAGCAWKLNELECSADIPHKFSPYVETSLSCNQYLNTDYIPTVNTRIEVDYALASAYTEGTWNIFRGKLDGSILFTCYHTANGFCFNNNKSWTNSGTPAYSNIPKVRRTAVLDNAADQALLQTAGNTHWSANSVNSTSLSGTGVPIVLSSKQDINGEFGSFRFYACRIYESNVLKHDFLPAVKNGVAGLQDRLGDKFLPVCSTGSNNPQVYGGAFPCTVTPASKKLPFGSTVTLAAAAPGAKSYRWLKNGVPVEGGMDGKLVVDWSKGEEMDVYQVIAVFEVDGVRVEGEASAGATVTNLPASFYFTIH